MRTILKPPAHPWAPPQPLLPQQRDTMGAALHGLLQAGNNTGLLPNDIDGYYRMLNQNMASLPANTKLNVQGGGPSPDGSPTSFADSPAWWQSGHDVGPYGDQPVQGLGMIAPDGSQPPQKPLSKKGPY